MTDYQFSGTDKEALFTTAEDIRVVNDEIKATLRAMSAPGGTQAYREEIWAQLEVSMHSVDARLLTLGLQPIYAQMKQGIRFYFVEYLSDSYPRTTKPS